MRKNVSQAARGGLTAIGMAAALGGGTAIAAPASPFSSEVITDGAAGWKIVVLRYTDAKQPDRSLEARVAPEMGGNLFSLKIGGDEILVQPEKLGDLTQNRSGTPVLFPTPNRVRDAKLSFEGRELTFEANNGKNFIHGLVRKRPWQFGEPKVTAAGVAVDTHIDWSETQPDFSRFPIKHKLTITYTLGRTGVRIAYAVENKDQQKLPFGLGLHPWFRVPGKRTDVYLTVPAAERMEAEDKLPTGKLVKVAGSEFDLRKPTSLDKLNLDDVFFGLTPAKLPAFEWRDAGVRVTLGGSKEFTHLVVYTPPDKPYFCVENQTSSTDAHNLYGKGKKREANLHIVAPGKTARGHVDWKVARVPPKS